jgi:LmbE family N-acetylglucosaminyl deacetylase
VTRVIAGSGTSAEVWADAFAAQPCPPLDLGALPAAGRVVALAAHPDDEVLGVGGLLSRLAAAGREIVAVWATDGEASHPGSTAFDPSRLRTLRRAESVAALARLGVTPVASHHLALPDSGLAGVAGVLRQRLAELVGPEDLVLTPWEGDGHPDHEAVGRAAEGLGAAVLAYPIWMWHWARPGEPAVPWGRLRAMPVPDVAAKAAAIDAFDTQVRPIGPGPADAAILPPHVVARFLGPVEQVVA